MHPKPIVEQVLEKDISLKLHSPDGPMWSHHMRKKLYKKHFSYVAPIAFKLGLNSDNIVRLHHYVPIRETLQVMMSDDSVYEQYMERQVEADQSPPPVGPRDITDGSYFKNRFSSQDSSAVCLTIYQDDVEMVNPLGSGKCKHKLNAFYYSLANLHPWSRSAIEPMQLIMLTRESDVVYFGLPAVLNPLISELKDLESNGIEIRGKHVKPFLLVLLGDNLGTHTVAGFVENFSRSHYFCRFCEESRKDWEERWYGGGDGDGNGDGSSEGSICGDDDAEEDDDDDSGSDVEAADVNVENSCIGDEGPEGSARDDTAVELVNQTHATAPLRTIDSYKRCVELLEENPGGVKGVVADSCFNQLDNFHVIGGTPPCLAHDLFEGTVNYDIYLALDYFKKKYKLTKDYVNRKIAKFPFTGEESRDKPARIPKRGSKLGGHAVQNWVLLRFLPTIIGDAIKNKKDPVWIILITLVLIVQIVCSPFVPLPALARLKNLINQYLRLRSQHFENKLRAKHHFLEHYDILLSKFGPLLGVATLRYETKHTFFRNCVRSARNFKITLSLSEQHQLLQSALSVNSLFNNNPVIEDGRMIDRCKLNDEIKLLIVQKFGEVLPTLLCGEKLTFRGTHFSKGRYLILSCLDGQVLLCKIETLSLMENTSYAVGVKCTGVHNDDLEVYEVRETSDITITSLSNLADYVPYPMYSLRPGCSVIVLKNMTF